MQYLKRITRLQPLKLSAKGIALKLLKRVGLSPSQEIPTSEKEVIAMMGEGVSHGVFDAAEKEMVEGVLELDEQTAISLMTPRSHIVWLCSDDEAEVNWRRIAQSGYSEFPIFQGTHDHVIGMVSVKSLWANLSLIGSVQLSDVMMPVLYVSASMSSSTLIEEFREKKRYRALVVDEFGVVVGIVTLKDVIESIMGILPEREIRQHYPKIEQQTEGEWLVDALVDFEEAIDVLGLPSPEEKEIRYQTIGGFVLHHLGHIPREGETLSWEKFLFEVLRMKRHRIDQLRVSVVRKPETKSSISGVAVS